MAKHQIFTCGGDSNVLNKSNENNIVLDISREEFMKWMENKGYNLDKIKQIFDSKKISSTEQSDFNILLRQAKEEVKISIIDIAVYFEESFAKFRKILSILDNETKFELKKELSKKFHIKLEETNLEEILGK